MNDFFGRFEIHIVCNISPGVVVGIYRFPGAGNRKRGNFRITEIRVVAQSLSDPAAKQGFRLQNMQTVDHGPGLFPGKSAGHVKPDNTEWSVMGEQLLQLGNGFVVVVLLIVLFAFVKIPIVATTVSLMPVKNCLLYTS